MATNNLKGKTDLDNDAKENLTGAGHVQQNSTIHVEGDAIAKVGGQVNGGVVAQSGNRVQAENQDNPESSRDA